MGSNYSDFVRVKNVPTRITYMPYVDPMWTVPHQNRTSVFSPHARVTSQVALFYMTNKASRSETVKTGHFESTVSKKSYLSPLNPGNLYPAMV